MLELSDVSTVKDLTSDLSKWTEEFRSAQAMTANGIIRQARLVSMLIQADIELPIAISAKWRGVLSRVAEGTALPEIVAAFDWSPDMQSRISKYSLDDQRVATSGKPLMVVVPGNDDDPWDEKPFLPEKMSPVQRRQVFGDDGLRDVPEQMAVIETQRTKAAISNGAQVGQVRLDKKRGGLWIGHVFIARKDLAQFVADLER